MQAAAELPREPDTSAVPAFLDLTFVSRSRIDSAREAPVARYKQ